MRRYSIVVPVYNRPAELDDLLDSLTRQEYTHFEVVVIEDGSSLTAEAVVDTYRDRLDIQYIFIENSGQGFARNQGFAKALGDYFVVLDSDTILPPHYLTAVNNQLLRDFLDAYGGPDRADASFSPMQKSISYAMTSFFTTGGIRGKAKNAGGDFQLRSFNMGLSRKVFKEIGGFAMPYMGEDIELSLRMKARGYRLGFIPEAYVFHKRRSDFAGFWRQVHFFGRARIHLHKLNPQAGAIKLVHALPAAFALFCALIPLWCLIAWPLAVVSALILQLFIMIIFVDASLKNDSLKVGLLSVGAAFVQLLGYGSGFIREAVSRLFT